MASQKLTVIFDFDGTLADTFVTSLRIFEKITHRSEPFSDQEIMRFRGLNAFNVVRELRIKPWRVPWLLVRGRAMMRKQLDDIVVFEGIPEVLQQLQDADIQMYIMSSNSPGNIRKLLAAHNLDHYFTRVYGNVGIFGKSKRLRQVIERNRLDAEQVVYIGDEGRDIEAAKRVGVRNVAVAWGFNSTELLSKHHPTQLVQTRQELVRALLGMQAKD